MLHYIWKIQSTAQNPCNVTFLTSPTVCQIPRIKLGLYYPNIETKVFIFFVSYGRLVYFIFCRILILLINGANAIRDRKWEEALGLLRTGCTFDYINSYGNSSFYWVLNRYSNVEADESNLLNNVKNEITKWYEQGERAWAVLMVAEYYVAAAAAVKWGPGRDRQFYFFF